METRKNVMLKTFRFATFNAALNRNQAGLLISDLSTPNNQQAQNVAEIIQRVNPDVLALQEFDYDKDGKALQLFQDNYLRLSQNGAQSIYFKYSYAVPSNTGILSGMDLDKDGKTDSPSDALGYGFHPGQYAFAILSKYPIQLDKCRTFQKFLWKDMPGARLPQNWFSAQALEIFRLSSKNHIDMPIKLPTGIIHILVAHPTPPVFDGDERRNKRRNFDEIRLLADYITPAGKGDYLYDDKGQKGGLDTVAHFVIMGDMNASPVEGDRDENAINQVLKHPRVHQQVGYHHTTNWGLCVDYVLPSKNLKVYTSGLFWPKSSEPLYYLVEKAETSSDHRLVWVDLSI
ncbi:hypothetical protein PN36_05130 [Candidatus Thiomargarita nelsonii]|uniref:Endonuclease/exonuclease/phosphatase domain-containing protein n=1 Tax=Candidatus Thiomargarita nelsonii TaxID=1003181 RepID=A0A4E0QS28_9GAMM|nr:hypothetical protein PN36_05130 [Candidatus Thiomargarita nelsonii]